MPCLAAVLGFDSPACTCFSRMTSTKVHNDRNENHMADHVFISHAAKDRAVAEAACATLEAGGLRCWMAPRDVVAGAPQSEAIIQGINACRAMVLVFSAHSRDCPQVKREAQEAVNKGLAVVALRIADVPSSGSLEDSAPSWRFLLDRCQGLDAIKPPLQDHLARLAETLARVLARPGPGHAGTGKAPRSLGRLPGGLVGVGLLPLCSFVVGLVLSLGLAGRLGTPGPVAGDDPATNQAGGKRDNSPGREPAKRISNSVGMELVYIPPGKFLMGSSREDLERFKKETQSLDFPGWDRIEGPRHEVRLSRGFYMGVYEVTQRQYQRVMGNNASHNQASPDHPVEEVTADEAIAFCKKLSERAGEKQAGKVYRLPTEAQWEYACRAGAAFHWGDSLSSRQANFNGQWPFGGAEKGPNIGTTVKVGSYQPNAWGLHDMHGNVWEWCLDGPRAYSSAPVDDPQGPEDAGGLRLLRGGSYLDDASSCRCAFRNRRGSSIPGCNVGFRVVCLPGTGTL
jgi:formylglycine-generating enzyme required for sulfatase activity